MIEEFKKWFREIQQEAIDEKIKKARKNGDETAWKKEIWRSPDKNKAIKARFRDEGAKRGFKSRPSYVTGAGEWLYDFVWREFDENNDLKRIVLTMEIEISDKSFRYDFNKLLQADSPYKIMVFQLKHEAEIQGMFASLTSAIDAYQAKVGAHYLLCGWCTSQNNFMFSDHVVEATHWGIPS